MDNGYESGMKVRKVEVTRCHRRRFALSQGACHWCEELISPVKREGAVAEQSETFRYLGGSCPKAPSESCWPEKVMQDLGVDTKMLYTFSHSCVLDGRHVPLSLSPCATAMIVAGDQHGWRSKLHFTTVNLSGEQISSAETECW